jgi:hypothetical protein
MQLTSGQTNLIILLVSVGLVYYFYPEHINVIVPIFTAITLYFSSDETIVSMFNNKTINFPVISDFIIKYKMYIMIILVAIGIYFTSESFKTKNVSHSSQSDLKDSSYSSTKLFPRHMSNTGSSIDLSSMSSVSETLPSSSSSSSSTTQLMTKIPRISTMNLSSNDDVLFSFN